MKTELSICGSRLANVEQCEKGGGRRGGGGGVEYLICYITDDIVFMNHGVVRTNLAVRLSDVTAVHIIIVMKE